MTRTGHYAAGAVAGGGLALALGWSPLTTLATVALAAAVGPLPDVDQRRWFKRSLGAFRVFGHRRLTHFWPVVLPLLVAIPFVPHPIAQLLAAVAIGWLSHLVGDWVFGKRQPAMFGGRPAGIPVWYHRGHEKYHPRLGHGWQRGRWVYHGLGLKSDGVTEYVAKYAVLPLVLVLELATMMGVL